jgi:superfamily II DNA helicase RecQ
MALQYKFFKIPIRSAEQWEEAINRFLRSVRVVHVQREFVDRGENSFWALAIEYMTTDGGTTISDSRRRRIDYKTVLSPEDFAVFVKLREWRKGVAAEEGVPVYTIFTNEQLARIAEGRVQSQGSLADIEGIGKSRLAKYGTAVIEIVSAMLPDEKEESEQ